MSVMMVWMVIGSIGGVMRAPGGKQRTSKKKQPESFFAEGEQKRSVHN